MSVCTGYAMQQPYIPLNASAFVIQDALDALEYANGGPETRYGAMRVANGHPASFNLRRLEVGNEERAPLGGPDGYAAHFRAIVQALRRADPGLTVIASGRWEWPANWSSVADSPCVVDPSVHCDLWDEHYYRSPADMVALADSYDFYDRTRYPKVYVGEYAALGGPNPSGTLLSALSEAAFILGFEHNADLVQGSSFAPLFSNVAAEQWKYNLIQYNATHSFRMVSWYVQRMFRDALLEGGGPGGSGEVYTVATRLTGNMTKVVATVSSISAVAAAPRKFLTLKVLNYGEKHINCTVSLTGFGAAVSTSARVTTLTAASPDVGNDLDNPTRIVDSESTLAGIMPGGFSLYVPPWSLSFVRLSIS